MVATERKRKIKEEKSQSGVKSEWVRERKFQLSAAVIAIYLFVEEEENERAAAAASLRRWEGAKKGKWIEKSNQSNLRFALSIPSLQHLLHSAAPLERQFYNPHFLSHSMCDDEFSLPTFQFIFVIQSLCGAQGNENESNLNFVSVEEMNQKNPFCENSRFRKNVNLHIKESVVEVVHKWIITDWFRPHPHMAKAHDVNSFTVIKILCITYWRNRRGILFFNMLQMITSFRYSLPAEKREERERVGGRRNWSLLHI